MKNDALSRAASVVRRIRRESEDILKYDRLFDAGEFSEAAAERAQTRDINEALALLGFTADSYNDALRTRCGYRFFYFPGLSAD